MEDIKRKRECVMKLKDNGVDIFIKENIANLKQLTTKMLLTQRDRH